MNQQLLVLVTTAATVGVVHTAVGLDHTLPFVLLGRARAWSITRTLGITGLCGVGHVLSSIVVGGLGASLGVALSSLAWFESTRGDWVAWALVAFGVTYAAVSLVSMKRGSAHQHVHLHADGTVHSHHHPHRGAPLRFDTPHHIPSDAELVRLSAAPSRHRNLVASLFVVFVLGPCEALLPLMTAPSLHGHLAASGLVALVFGGATVLTMLALVAAGWFGLHRYRLVHLERHLNWISGVVIAGSGLGIRFLGL